MAQRSRPPAARPCRAGDARARSLHGCRPAILRPRGGWGRLPGHGRRSSPAAVDRGGTPRRLAAARRGVGRHARPRSCRTRCRPDRLRARGRPPRRGGRPPGGRTLRHAGAGARGHRDRGGAHRLAHARRRPGHRCPRPRHRVRGRDDHPQRHRRALPAGGQHAPRRAGVRSLRGQCVARDAGHHGRADAGAAQHHDQHRRPDLLGQPARTHRGGLARALRRLRAGADRAPPRLLPARGRGRARRGGACGPAEPAGGGRQRPPAPGVPGSRRAAGQGAGTDDRARGGRGRRPQGGDRRA